MNIKNKKKENNKWKKKGDKTKNKVKGKRKYCQ